MAVEVVLATNQVKHHTQKELVEVELAEKVARLLATNMKRLILPSIQILTRIKMILRIHTPMHLTSPIRQSSSSTNYSEMKAKRNNRQLMI